MMLRMPYTGAAFRAFVSFCGFRSRSASSAVCSYIGTLASASCLVLSRSHPRVHGLLCFLLCAPACARGATLCRSCCLQGVSCTFICFQIRMRRQSSHLGLSSLSHLSLAQCTLCLENVSAFKFSVFLRFLVRRCAPLIYTRRLC